MTKQTKTTDKQTRELQAPRKEVRGMKGGTGRYPALGTFLTQGAINDLLRLRKKRKAR